MPIVYVHGVTIRDDREWDDLELLLRRYIAPKIADDPENVYIKKCYWGDFGAKFRWSGASAPSSPLRNMVEGFVAKTASGLASERQKMSAFTSLPNLKAGATDLAKRAKSTLEAVQKTRLTELSKDNLSELCSQLFAQSASAFKRNEALSLIAADEVAHDAKTLGLLERCKNIDDELKLFEELVASKYESLRSQFKQVKERKVPDVQESVALSVEESLARSAHGAGYAISRAAVEIKSPINRFLTLFMGDVLTYMNERGDYRSPGWIPSAVLSALSEARENQLERNDETLIVMSHSMGGQIMYDTITHFLPRSPEHQGIKVDFWAATASQVALFEELKLFLESSEEYSRQSGLKVPFPDRNVLGYWWNVWDHNDFVSWSGRDIFEGIDDEGYNSGMFIVDAHFGYLLMPSFFRRFAKKVAASKTTMVT